MILGVFQSVFNPYSSYRRHYRYSVVGCLYFLLLLWSMGEMTCYVSFEVKVHNVSFDGIRLLHISTFLTVLEV